MPKIYLAVGHGVQPSGGYDPGASGGGWSEQTAGDIVVAEAAKKLRAAGAEVKDEAHKDDPNFVGTARDANAWGADYVVTFHHDWSGAPDGAFGHWISAAGKALADDIQQAVGRADFPLRGSWHKRRTDLYVLKATDAPTVLYECGKIGQKELRTEDGLKKMGRAIASGIARHVGLNEEEEMPLTKDDLVAIKREVWGYQGWNDDHPADAWSILRTILREQVDADDLAKALADKLEVSVSGTSAKEIVEELAKRLQG